MWIAWFMRAYIYLSIFIQFLWYMSFLRILLNFNLIFLFFNFYILFTQIFSFPPFLFTHFPFPIIPSPTFPLPTFPLPTFPPLFPFPLFLFPLFPFPPVYNGFYSEKAKWYCINFIQSYWYSIFLHLWIFLSFYEYFKFSGFLKKTTIHLQTFVIYDFHLIWLFMNMLFMYMLQTVDLKL